MTQPIQKFQNLTSETTAGGNAITKTGTKTGFSFEDRRRLEQQARYARAVAVSEWLVDGLLWAGRQLKRLTAAVRADFKLRAAEAQLHRMTDRELSDLGLTRADIHFAVRETVEGVMPQFDAHAGHVTPANQNVRRAA
ncbi:MAG TPA: DUF1127 domain-containing protein [Reyranella sp.]|nr:DUF1127 domain-containing protein [Reyranella sp.]